MIMGLPASKVFNFLEKNDLQKFDRYQVYSEKFDILRRSIRKIISEFQNSPDNQINNKSDHLRILISKCLCLPVNFDQNISVHNGLYSSSYFIELVNILIKKGFTYNTIKKEYINYWLGKNRSKIFEKLLKLLKFKSIPVYIITSNSKQYVKQFLDRINYLKFF